VATGAAFDKAGGYAFRSRNPVFVAAFEGSASNVIGLPMAQTEALLARVGFEPVRWGPPRPT
jgi:septum formation protein